MNPQSSNSVEKDQPEGVECPRVDPAAADLGIHIDELRDGCAKVSVLVSERMLNSMGTCHGGYLFFLADTAFGAACNAGAPQTMAADASIVFLRPVVAGEHLTAIAQRRSIFGRNSIYDVTVHTANGQTVAEFRGRCVRIRGDR